MRLCHDNLQELVPEAGAPDREGAAGVVGLDGPVVELGGGGDVGVVEVEVYFFSRFYRYFFLSEKKMKKKKKPSFFPLFALLPSLLPLRSKKPKKLESLPVSPPGEVRKKEEREGDGNMEGERLFSRSFFRTREKKEKKKKTSLLLIKEKKKTSFLLTHRGRSAR